MDTMKGVKRLQMAAFVVLVIVAIIMVAFCEPARAKSKGVKPKKIQYVVEYTNSQWLDDFEIRSGKTYLRWKPVKKADGYIVKIKYQGLSAKWSKWFKYTCSKNKLGMGEVSNNCGYVMKVKVRPYKKKNGKKVTFGKWSKVRYIDACAVARKVISDGADEAVG